MPALTDVARLTLRIDLPHATYTAYEQQATRLHRSAEQVMATQLDRFADVRVDDRPLIVDSATRNALEGTLGTPLVDAAALLKACQRATEISIGGIKLALEPWQLAELKRRAEKNGTKPAEEVAKAVAQIQSLVFNGAG